jgi:hypothetical protein
VNVEETEKLIEVNLPAITNKWVKRGEYDTPNLTRRRHHGNKQQVLLLATTIVEHVTVTTTTARRPRKTKEEL